MFRVTVTTFFSHRQAKHGQHGGFPVPDGAEGAAQRSCLHCSPTGGFQGGLGGIYAALHLLQADSPALTSCINCFFFFSFNFRY